MARIFIYRSLLWLLFPAIAVGTVAIALRDGSMRYLKQRLGRFHSTSITPKPLWIHCASVGETNTALPFIETWLKHHPNDRFVLTTNTITASKILKLRTPKSMENKIRHYYLPLDYPSFCRHFLNTVTPCCALIMETEIWLNLFLACHHANIPLFIINARLSQRTLNNAKRFKFYYRQSLALVEKIFSRSEKDAVAFSKLGAATEKVEVVGNLKFANKITDETDETLLELKATLAKKRYILAASTHANEEIQIAETWQKAMQTNSYNTNTHLLLIAPRHPHRGHAIAQRLRHLGFSTQLRSHTSALQEKTSVYIADTIGELPTLIRHADLVFTGGSLVPIGGHNVLEAAQLGTPQVVGPYTDNFSEEINALKLTGGLIEVADTDALEKVFVASLNKDPTHAEIAKKALTLMQQYENIASVYVTRVENTSMASPKSS